MLRQIPRVLPKRGVPTLPTLRRLRHRMRHRLHRLRHRLCQTQRVLPNRGFPALSIFHRLRHRLRHTLRVLPNCEFPLPPPSTGCAIGRERHSAFHRIGVSPTLRCFHTLRKKLRQTTRVLPNRGFPASSTFHRSRHKLRHGLRHATRAPPDQVVRSACVVGCARPPAFYQIEGSPSCLPSIGCATS